MGILTDFFAATPQELADLVIEWGPVPPEPEPPKAKGGLFGFGKKPAPVPDGPLEPYGPTLPAVQAKGILNTQLGMLDQFVTGTSYAHLVEMGAIDALVRDAGEQGPWVFPVRRELRDGLASLDAGRGRAIARQWGEDEELGATDPEEFAALETLVGDLSGLARSAVDTDRDLYLWASL
jgi:hypothetical protein